MNLNTAKPSQRIHRLTALTCTINVMRPGWLEEYNHEENSTVN